MSTRNDDLRPWQQAAMALYRERGGPQDFLVTATPGAGKTTYALATARMLWDAGMVRRVIVVCPTDHLRKQWVEAALREGFDLRRTPNGESLPKDADGVVVTYAQVAAAPRVHMARCKSRATLVVFDEVHHAGDAREWGTAVVDAFERARHRLSITGTPFRSDGSRIPHVNYVETADGGWESQADFTYGYADALADKVVRPVVFAAYAGSASWRNSAGDVQEAMFGAPDVAKAVEEEAWRAALSPDGEWIPHVFAAMQHRLAELRAGRMPDAKALVLASNQEQARAYADVWEQMHDERPLLIVSDDPEASSKISQFRDDPACTVAVSVRMVSEGVDVPAAAVLGFCCTASTPLFFAQAVGRVVRTRGAGETATVFLPAVRRLLGLAAEMERERNHIIEPDPDSDEHDLDPLPVEEPEPGDAEGWAAVSSTARFDSVISSSSAPADGDYLGLPGLLDPEQEAALLRRRDAEAAAAAKAATARRSRERKAAERKNRQDEASARWNALERAAATGSVAFTAPEAAQASPETSGEAEGLRKEVAAVVRGYAASKGVDHGKAWGMLYARVPGPKNASAPVSLLQRRLEAARKMK